MKSAICFNLGQSKILSSGNRFRAKVIAWRSVTHLCVSCSTNKVSNKETNEQMHSRMTATGQDLNLKLPGERPTSYPLS